MSKLDLVELQDQGIVDATIFIAKLKGDLAAARAEAERLRTAIREATLPDPVRLIADRIAANVKYEEDQAVRCNRDLEDEDEFTTWSTLAEARAFLDAIRTIDTSVSKRT